MLVGGILATPLQTNKEITVAYYPSRFCGLFGCLFHLVLLGLTPLVASRWKARRAGASSMWPQGFSPACRSWSMSGLCFYTHGYKHSQQAKASATGPLELCPCPLCHSVFCYSKPHRWKRPQKGLARGSCFLSNDTILSLKSNEWKGAEI